MRNLVRRVTKGRVEIGTIKRIKVLTIMKGIITINHLHIAIS